MSSVYRYPNISPRQQENQWMNLIWGTHDQFCECNDPQLHFLILMNRDSNCRKPESDVRNIKCLLTGKDPTTSTTTKDEEDGGFLEGELEKLFDEGPTEEKDTDDIER